MSELRVWLRGKLAEIPRDWIGTLRWLFALVAGDRVRIVGLSVLRTIGVLMGVAVAAVTRWVIDAASTRADSVWVAIAVFVAVQVVTRALSMALAWVSTTLGERLSNVLRARLYRRVLAARWDMLARFHSEQLLARLTSDVGSISSGLTDTVVSLTAMLVQAVAAFALLAHYDASLAVFVLILTPAAVLTSALVSVHLRIIQQCVQQAEADYRQRAQEAIAHVDVVKALCAEESEAHALEALQREHEKLVHRRARLSVIANGVMGFAFVIAYLVAFLSGIAGIIAGTVTYGTFTAFLSLVSQVQSSLAGLGGILPRAASVMASAARVREVAELESEHTVEPPARGEVSCAPLGICARTLTFTYPGAAAPVFRDADLRIAPGEVVAVMGPSGAGKTTLVRLLLGLLEPTSGELAYTRDGARIPCRDARGQVSYVPQGNTLMSGTIRENLCMGGIEATDDELWHALDAVTARAFVAGLPGGLDARVGERAHGISEGQAQRIAIARALVRPAGVLVLDEATSALDEATELCVMRSLRALAGQPTCLVITHRPEVVPWCDRVITVVEHGDSARFDMRSVTDCKGA